MFLELIEKELYWNFRIYYRKVLSVDPLIHLVSHMHNVIIIRNVTCTVA